jgi:hypothetical protein
MADIASILHFSRADLLDTDVEELMLWHAQALRLGGAHG